jgi:hypothetical protein
MVFGRANLAARNGQGGGKTFVEADQLSPANGQMIGVVEGSEAANPYGAHAGRCLLRADRQ